jgi:hypothetical protein
MISITNSTNTQSFLFSCWVCLASWHDIILADNSKHYDHCTYYTGLPGGNPAPRPLIPKETRPKRNASATETHYGIDIGLPGPGLHQTRQDRVEGWVIQQRINNAEMGIRPEGGVQNSNRPTRLRRQPNLVRLRINEAPYPQGGVNRPSQRPPTSRPQVSIGLAELNAMHGNPQSQVQSAQGVSRLRRSPQRNNALLDQLLEENRRVRSTRRVRFSLPETPLAGPSAPRTVNLVTMNNTRIERGLVFVSR